MSIADIVVSSIAASFFVAGLLSHAEAYRGDYAVAMRQIKRLGITHVAGSLAPAMMDLISDMSRLLGRFV
jgi:hypothetical protein